jgi:hypothetical protein
MERKGRNRVAVGMGVGTLTQGSSFLATLGYGPESRWGVLRNSEDVVLDEQLRSKKSTF